MGGFGSGNYLYYDIPKKTVEASLDFDIDNLRRCGQWKYRSRTVTWRIGEQQTGQIAWHLSSDDRYVHLSYRVDGEPVEQAIELEGRPQRVGGIRYYMRCPACTRSVRILYGESRFLCRRCHDLTYRSCQDSHKLDGLYAMLASDLASKYGISYTGKDVREVLELARMDMNGSVGRRRKKPAGVVSSKTGGIL